jgi:hypothetical protein
MGVGVGIEKEDLKSRSPIVTIHRNRNAFVFSGYQPDPDVALKLQLQPGAPLFTGLKNKIEGGSTVYKGPPSWHHICRAFVAQPYSGTVECRILPPIQHGCHGRLLISGARRATVRFFPEPGTEESLEILRNPQFPYFVGEFEKPRFGFSGGVCVTVENVEDEILFSW